ncbi:hypothetical protein [Streptomyces sp. NPDC052114]|uniref:hypothetical protein n=1 Tax=unclassified Streptomyces TaxID=2593676 RepID=UPI00341A45A7
MSGEAWADMTAHPDVDPDRAGPARLLRRLSRAIGDVPDDACEQADWERMVALATRPTEYGRR